MFRLDEPRKVILRVTTWEMMDYNLGLFPSTTDVKVPFFRSAPGVIPIKLGETFTSPLLDGSAARTCAAYCSMTLPAGDYKVTLGFRRADGKSSNIMGSVDALNTDGMITLRVGHINEIDMQAIKSFGMALSEEQSMIFRVSAEQRLMATLKVEPLRQE
jgi:hypothetical protein